MRTPILLLLAALRLSAAADFSARFEEIRKTASPSELYSVLFALPNGGDLHHHSGLSAYASVWYRIATSAKTLARNSFYTMTQSGNCPNTADSLPRFYTIQRSRYEALDPCQKALYRSLASLSPELRDAWTSSLILDKPGEARDEFFERIVPRFGDLTHDPWLYADVIVENMRLFGAEGVRYIEAQIEINGFIDATGKAISAEDAHCIIAGRLNQPDGLATGVTMRFQGVIIRSTPDAPQRLEAMYAWVAAHRDRWVGINMAGREDNDKGYALRFLETYRKMRRTYSNIPLSIHAGEKDSPGHEVRDTLLLGATRIGHGVNLITDPDTMLLMRNGNCLVEINLVSNRVLDYVPDTATHPFPEYLRFGIPVCLNTDDRGSWDSNMTDEYYTAVTNFHLTWKEIVELGRNSLTHSFAEAPLKAKMLHDYEAALAAFETKLSGPDWRATMRPVKPLVSGYATRTWGFHD
ncbi:MAG: adenosine deaminase [Bryobacterales bacterium]|jgi:adenosine deaminase CECR1|nr:adenosine deaminase [Bryobacterales bacterium]